MLSLYGVRAAWKLYVYCFWKLTALIKFLCFPTGEGTVPSKVGALYIWHCEFHYLHFVCWDCEHCSIKKFRLKFVGTYLLIRNVVKFWDFFTERTFVLQLCLSGVQIVKLCCFVANNLSARRKKSRKLSSITSKCFGPDLWMLIGPLASGAPLCIHCLSRLCWCFISTVG